jgi:undecaprenyl diphosphate synthase
MIESIKKIIDSTKDYDNYFVNFCINYDGQEEIVDACKMVARRVKLGKIEVDSITKETIKDDLYSSYFLPPDFIFVTGKKRSVSGFLLWDSVNSEIVFTNRLFPELTVKDIEKGISPK